ncbi:MAG: cell division protein FtsQ/DivIB [Eubacteriales bacterium]|nr:cell division protein FtsQ/DivIB [Eubacteriales bacterium]
MAAALLLVIAALFMKITTITVTGNERYSDEQIVQMLFPDSVSRNTGFCYLKDHVKEHVAIPFVEDYEIVFKSLTEVEVIIYEKSVVGYVSYMSSYMYFDKDGIIVESANQRLPGIPQITGLKFGHIVLYQKLPVESEEIFQEILNLTQILSIYELSVDRIQYNSFGEATLYMGDIEVSLGNNSSLNGKIAELCDMLPQLEGLKGTLKLEQYDDTNANPMYSFIPRE